MLTEATYKPTVSLHGPKPGPSLEGFYVEVGLETMARLPAGG